MTDAAPSRACWTCGAPATRGDQYGAHVRFYCARHGGGSSAMLSAPTPQLGSWAECVRCHRMVAAIRDERTVTIRVGIRIENPGWGNLCHCDEEPSDQEWLKILVP